MTPEEFERLLDKFSLYKMSAFEAFNVKDKDEAAEMIFAAADARYRLVEAFDNLYQHGKGV